MIFKIFEPLKKFHIDLSFEKSTENACAYCLEDNRVEISFKINDFAYHDIISVQVRRLHAFRFIIYR